MEAQSSAPPFRLESPLVDEEWLLDFSPLKAICSQPTLLMGRMGHTALTLWSLLDPLFKDYAKNAATRARSKKLYYLRPNHLA